MSQQKVKIGFDNRNNFKKIGNKIKKSNAHAQESRESAIIERLQKKIKFDVELVLVKGHNNDIGMHSQYPLKYLVIERDRKI